MQAFATIVRNRLTAAAQFAGIESSLPERPVDVAVSVAIREACRCGIPLSVVLNEPFGLDCDS